MKPNILIIMDGFGLGKDYKGNAIKHANTPNIDYLLKKYPNSKLHASSNYVGLPENQMGNSEVGHLNIGAGRIVCQELLRINSSIKDKSFFKNKSFLKAIRHCKKNKSSLHLMGLVSDGGIHSHIDHLLNLIDLCKKEKFYRVYIHAFLDGRDTMPLIAHKFIKQIEEKIKDIGFGKIVTIAGRYYAMNRDKNWKLTKMAYDCMVNKKSDHIVKTIHEAFELEYKENVTDEFMQPTIINSNGIDAISDNDSIIAFNYRSDRMIQLLHAFNDKNFSSFERERKLRNIVFVTMTPYEEKNIYKNLFVAYPLENKMKNIFSNWIEKNKLSQLRITEFEKSKHVTYFFDGLKDNIKKKEKRIILPRKDVFTYDQDPKMQSEKITQEVLNNYKKYNFIIVNYPNCDAVGHSGKISETIKAVEAVDESIGKIISKINLNEVNLIITADHGNAEHMIDEKTNEPDKMHTTNMVPFIICSNNYELQDGKLSDIAPTILSLNKLKIPKEMTGTVLIKQK